MNLLTAQGLVLEPQVVAHARELFEPLSDPALYEFENEPPASLESLEARFRKLESRRSADGSEWWLNWVIRLPDDRLAGFVQATVRETGDAEIAYVLSSKHWGRSLARLSVEVVLKELAENYSVRMAWAVFKSRNARSRHLLERLNFQVAQPADCERHELEADESLMWKAISDS